MKRSWNSWHRYDKRPLERHTRGKNLAFLMVLSHVVTEFLPLIFGAVPLNYLTCMHLEYVQDPTDGNPHPIRPIVEFIPNFIHGLFKQVRIQQYAEC